MWIKFKIDEDSEEGQYFLKCAEIRKISATSLFKRLSDAINKDQMVLSILDDDSKPVIKHKNEHKFSKLKFAGANK